MDVDVLSKEYLIAVCACESAAIKSDRRMDGQTDWQMLFLLLWPVGSLYEGSSLCEFPLSIQVSSVIPKR